MKKSSDVDLSRGVFSCAGVEPTSIIRLFKFSVFTDSFDVWSVGHHLTTTFQKRGRAPVDYSPRRSCRDPLTV